MPEGISIGLMRVPAIIKKFLASTTTSEVESAIAPKEAAYTPTFTGFGTPTNVNFTWCRAGNRIKVMGKFTSGTTTAVEARISLPNSLVSDSSLITSLTMCGTWCFDPVGSSYQMVLIEAGVGYVTFGHQDASTGGLVKRNGNVLISNSNLMSLNFEFGISGWNV
jgi:hypothetical protein